MRGPIGGSEPGIGRLMSTHPIKLKRVYEPVSADDGTRVGRTPAVTYDAGRPVDMMDKPDGLPTSPPAQQQQQDVINRILAA